MRDPYATLRHGLVAAWCPSLGASGYVLPSVVPQRSLTHNGAITAAPGGGQALELTTNQYAELTNSDLLYGYGPKDTSYGAVEATEVTWSMWVRMRSFPNAENVLFETRDATFSTVYQMSGLIKSNGKLAFFVISKQASPLTQQFYNGTGAFTLATNTWYHIAFVWRAGVIQSGYVNGILDGSASTPASGIASALGQYPINIGRSVFGSRWLDGWVDDIRVYRRALPVSDLRLLASQRGIGLRPQRRRVGLASGSAFWLRQSGEWKKATTWINVGGTWKQAMPKLNVSGTWK